MAGEWHVVRFERLLAEPVRNGIYKPKEFHGRGAKIVNMGELFAYPRLRAVPMKRVELSTSETERFMLAEGDLIFARRSLTAAGAGKCSVVVEIDEPTTFESSIIRARPNKLKAEPLYLYYFFNSDAGLHSLDTIRRQVAVAGITGSDLASLEIPMPSLPEQHAIAHILGTLDDKIELNRRMNETLETMARALFQSWFVDFEPVRAKMEGRDTGLPQAIADLFPDRLVESELGKIPRGWLCSTVGKHFKLTMGQSPPGSTYNESGDGLPFFQGRTDFGFRFPSRRVFCTAPTRLAEVGDALVCVRAPVGDVNIAIEQCAIGRGVAAARHLSRSSSFTYYAMHNLGEHFGKFEGEGTVFGSINKADFERLPFVAPPQAVLDGFERIASRIDERIVGCARESSTLTGLRDTLLPQLISGELRIHDAKQFIAEVMA